jgi:hypothetical protein
MLGKILSVKIVFVIGIVIFTFFNFLSCNSEENEQELTKIKGLVLDVENEITLPNESVLIRFFDDVEQPIYPTMIYTNLVVDTIEVDEFGMFEYLVPEINKRSLFNTEILRQGYVAPYYRSDPVFIELVVGENYDNVWGVKCGYAKLILMDDIEVISDSIRINTTFGGGVFLEDFTIISNDTIIIRPFDHRFLATIVLDIYYLENLVKTEMYDFYPTWSDTVEFVAYY